MNDIFLNRNQPVSIRQGGNLPHWFQDGKAQFVTFRLADSLPQERVSELQNLTNKFCEEHPKPWSDEIKRDFRTIISIKEESLLNSGFGNCILSRIDVRKVMSDIIHSENGKSYNLISYVIMPNHVHMLFVPRIELSGIMRIIKGVSSRQINHLLGATGTIWMREYFDRIVQNINELKQYIEYIAENPQALNDETYELWIAKDNF